MKPESTPPKAAHSPGTKRPYSPPHLSCYGGLRDLTRGGTGSVYEADHPTMAGQCADNAAIRRICMAASDRGVKENIQRIGTHPLGFGIYLFDYQADYQQQWGCGRQFGVLAQEVEIVMPEAVAMHADGYRVVNYDMLGISRTRH